MNILGYLVRETFRSLRQEWMMVSAAVLTIGITLFFFTLITLSLINVTNWVSSQEESAEITVFCSFDLTSEEEIALAEKIEKRSDVERVAFVSRQEGYEAFISMYGAELLEAVDENPFPAAIEVTPTKGAGAANRINYLASTLQLMPGVETVTFASEWHERVKRFKGRVWGVGGMMLLILFVAIFFSIFNTIQLTVFARSQLVDNMQYVGASHWRIRAPFLLEGVVQGSVGAFFAWLAILVLRETLFAGIVLNWGDIFLFPLLLLGGSLLGLLSSYLAIRRFIR